MAPMMAMPAELMVGLVDPEANQKLKILDLAAGHGLYGIAFAKRIPKRKSSHWIGQMCWKSLRENARNAGVAQDRCGGIAGSAFNVDYGDGYDLVL